MSTLIHHSPPYAAKMSSSHIPPGPETVNSVCVEAESTQLRRFPYFVASPLSTITSSTMPPPLRRKADAF